MHVTIVGNETKDGLSGKSNGKRGKRPFVEPKLTRRESLIKSTLFCGAAAPGAAAILS